MSGEITEQEIRGAAAGYSRGPDGYMPALPWWQKAILLLLDELDVARAVVEDRTTSHDPVAELDGRRVYGCERRIAENLTGSPIYTDSALRVGAKVLDTDTLQAVEAELRIAVAELVDEIRQDRKRRS